jgi:hypothetical protein
MTKRRAKKKAIRRWTLVELDRESSRMPGGEEPLWIV